MNNFTHSLINEINARELIDKNIAKVLAVQNYNLAKELGLNLHLIQKTFKLSFSDMK